MRITRDKILWSWAFMQNNTKQKESVIFFSIYCPLKGQYELI